MAQTFSSTNRQHILRELETGSFDLLVIGGGITGAGIALDAQARGMKTALIEMQDFAAGTSSRSTKLIHGGLRYLKQLEIRLVAEVGKERAIVYENAPHVTTPVWMLLPLLQGGTYGKLAASVGLRVYDILAAVRKHERRVMLNKEQTVHREPLLRTDKLKGGGYYVEYRTDDARLTIEVMKEAVLRGATAINYVKAQQLLYEDARVVGVAGVDQLTGKTHEIRAKQIINATGPWVDEVREKDGSKEGKYIHLTKGVHLVIDGSRFPLRQAVYFDAPDGRMIFAIPRDGKAYIGTTDTDYKGDIAHPKMTAEDRDYLLHATNFMFPTLGLTANDVESSWAGLRPLIHAEGKSPSELSRRDEIFISDSGLLSIAGGKLTGYRKMAERIVDLTASRLKEQGHGTYPGSTTRKIRLSGGDVNGSENFEAFVKEKTREGTKIGLSETDSERLARRYGSNVNRVYQLIEQHEGDAKQYKLPKDVMGALLYSMLEEMVCTPEDFFVRRTGALYFDIGWVKQWKERVIAYLAAKLRWSEQEQAKYHTRLDELLHDAVLLHKG
ncbi:glycerol-3-phosphate dehydrogenase/oxidase [Paenibacillus xerothermodurans]|uniref:Glycerol-3-phosphate dehydrogenase n=1 Tax=Paenibacillus xerothermodurans TaxID=1977292 RepID=A0A2W1NC73_PAEXE|nr:glycerol-3-phosphate dehydrogenase/oxidase [Paenibacillus xerothermodurans]PZE21554.1 glycerol-3-phosphate dehydrogenase/oxidase [Paenibacillus xerothermodurans]